MFEHLKNKIFNDSKKLPTKIDVHSHFIPEIDDGCPDIKTSIHLIQQMKKLGYKKLITTPHIMSQKYPNTIKIIKQGLFELRSVLKVKNIDIEIEASAEYYCDEHFLQLIQLKDILSFGKNYVLFELPYTKESKYLTDAVKALLNKGYIPVLAHPERYRFLNTVIEYRNLKKQGMLFQVNVNSIAGYYGKEVQKKALMLSSKGMIDFIGSDMHHQKHMDMFKEAIFSNQIEILFRNNKILNDTI